jgi:GTPase SAR1 family protein
VLDRDLPQFKVAVMGERGVGKSSLFARLLGKSFKADEVKEDTTVNMGFRVFHTYDKVPAGSIEVRHPHLWTRIYYVHVSMSWIDG